MNVLDIYRACGAFHEGRFLLASGRHSPYFLQSTTVLQYPRYADVLGEALAEKIKASSWQPEFVLGPAMGGVVLSYVTARPLGIKAIFAEKDGKGGMKIREAFGNLAGATFVVVEDVMTTGGSVLKAVQAAQSMGATCVGIACIIDRRKNPQEALAGLPVVSLEQMYFDTYLPSEVPEWLAQKELQEI